MELPCSKVSYSIASPAQPEGHGHIAQALAMGREHLVVARFGKHFRTSTKPLPVVLQVGTQAKVAVGCTAANI